MGDAGVDAETMYYAAADRLVESGLRDAGYDTVLVTCAGWERDPLTSKLRENKVVWPRGYKVLLPGGTGSVRWGSDPLASRAIRSSTNRTKRFI